MSVSRGMTMTNPIKVDVGNLDEMDQRFVNAWPRLERGEQAYRRSRAPMPRLPFQGFQ